MSQYEDSAYRIASIVLEKSERCGALITNDKIVYREKLTKRLSRILFFFADVIVLQDSFLFFLVCISPLYKVGPKFGCACMTGA